MISKCVQTSYKISKQFKYYTNYEVIVTMMVLLKNWQNIHLGSIFVYDITVHILAQVASKCTWFRTSASLVYQEHQSYQMFSTPDYVSYSSLVEVFKEDGFNQHTIHTDIMTFDLYIREHIINVLEERMIMYIFDQEKRDNDVFYSVKHLRRIIERFCASNKDIIDFPYVIEHFYKTKIKPYFDWREVSYLKKPL